MKKIKELAEEMVRVSSMPLNEWVEEQNKIKCETCNRYYERDLITAFQNGEPVCQFCLDNADTPDGELEKDEE